MGGACGAQTSNVDPGFTTAVPHPMSTTGSGNGASSPQPMTDDMVKNDGYEQLDPAVKVKLLQLLSVCQCTPQASSKIAEAAAQLSRVATAVSGNQIVTPDKNQTVTEDKTSSPGSSQDCAGQGRDFMSAAADKTQHHLVCSRRETTVVRPIADIPKGRLEFLEHQAGKWDVDVIDMSGDEQVVYLEMLYARLNLNSTFGISEAQLRRFLLTVRSLYHEKNPYHNFTHATDVGSSVVHLIEITQGNSPLTELDKLCLLTSAIGHDIDHPGLNQGFQKAIRSDIAMTHNYRSVLENHHLNVLFSTLSMGCLNIFSYLTPEQFSESTDTIVDAILATDIGRHWELSASIASGIAKLNSKQGSSGLPERRIWCMALLKMADISNPAKPFATSQKWASRVLDEFFAQGDLERSFGLPISVLCDRNAVEMTQSQIGFLQYVVRPFFTLCSELAPGTMEEIMDLMDSNMELWGAKKEAKDLLVAQQQEGKVKDYSAIKAEVNMVRQGGVIGLEMLEGRSDEEVMGLIVHSNHQKLNIKGDLQDFVDSLKTRTDAQTVVLFWRSMYQPGALQRVACTSGYTSAIESFVVEDAVGLTGYALRECTAKSAFSFAETDLDQDAEKDKSMFDPSIDGHFTHNILAVPIYDKDKVLRGLVQLRNKAALVPEVDQQGSGTEREDGNPYVLVRGGSDLSGGQGKQDVMRVRRMSRLGSLYSGSSKWKRGLSHVGQGKPKCAAMAVESPFTDDDILLITYAASQVREELEANGYEFMMQARINGVFNKSEAEAWTDDDDAELAMMEIINVFCDEARQLVKADRSSVYLVNKYKELTTAVNKDGVDDGTKVMLRLPPGQGSIAGACASTGEEIIIEDAYEDPRFDRSADQASGYRTNTILCVPINDAAGTVIGVVQMINKQKTEENMCFDLADAVLIRGMVAKAAVSIEKAQLFNTLKAMSDATSTISTTLDLDNLIQQVMHASRVLLKADRCTLFLHDQQTQILWSKLASVNEGEKAVTIRVKSDTGIAGRACQTKTMVNVPDAYQDQNFDKVTDERTGYKTQSILCAPFCDARQEVLGVMQMINKFDGDNNVCSFTKNDEVTLGSFCTHVAAAISNARIFEGTSQAMGAVCNMAAVLPDMLIAVNPKGEYLCSNHPLKEILSDTVHVSECEGVIGANDIGSSTNEVIKWAGVSDQLERDVTRILGGKKKICNYEEEFKAGSLMSECKGYELISLGAQGDVVGHAGVTRRNSLHPNAVLDDPLAEAEKGVDIHIENMTNGEAGVVIILKRHPDLVDFDSSDEGVDELVDV